MTHAPANQPCNCGLPGWMPGVSHQPIEWTLPRWIRDRAGKMEARAIVDHIMVGWLTTMEDWAVHGGRKIIAHFGIDRVGRIVQFHPVDTPGIHVSGIISPQSTIVRSRGQDPGTTGANGYTIGIEHEGFSLPYDPPIPHATWTRSNPWPAAMVEASIRVKVWCFKTVPSLGQPSRDTVIGHYEIDARNRPDDPADHNDRSVWPVDTMLARLGGGGGGDEEGYVDRDYRTVRPGETMGAIARELGTTVAELAALNDIEDPNFVRAGQPLRTNESVPIVYWPTAKTPDTSKIESGAEVMQRVAADIKAEARRIGGK